MTAHLNTALFKGRFLIAALFFLVTLYFALFSRLTPEFGVTFTWLGSELHVTQIDRLLDKETAFQEGDVVLSIEGVPVARNRLLTDDFSQPTYTFNVLREGETISLIAPNDSTAPRRVEPESYVAAFLLCLLGALTLIFAREHNQDAVILGLTCQVAGVITLSALPGIWGAAGAWIVYYLVLPLCAPLAVLLAYFPLEATGWRSSPFWKIFLTISLALIGLNIVEFALLTLRGSSTYDLVGFSLGSVALLAIALAIFSNVLILINRLVKQNANSYARQQAKVLLFFSLFGFVPFVAFAVLPAIIRAFLPTTLGLMFLLFAPIGYFYVTFRRGYLKLDLLFSRVITVSLLVTCAVLAYSAFLGVAERIYPSLYERLLINQTILAIFTVSAVVMGQRLAGSFVEDLLFGKSWIRRDQLFEVTVHFSNNPERETLQEAVEVVAATLDVETTVVIHRDQSKGGRFKQLAGVGDEISDDDLENLTDFDSTALRTTDPQSFSSLPEWVELLVPIKLHEEMLGVLLLSQPRDDGYFNARQVSSVEELANVLAVNMQVMNLVQATTELTNNLVLVRQIERHQLAAALHNEPLQDLSIIAMQLQTAENSDDVQAASEQLRSVSRKLRQIVAGLRPTTVNKSIEWMTREIARDFELQQPQIRVTLDLSIEDEEIPSEMATWAFHDVLKESLNNIRKHARATHVNVVVSCSAHGLSLTVADNGVGTDFSQMTLNDLLRQRHFGLAEMHRWALIAGGRLEMRHNEPAGTIVHLWLPTKEEKTFASLNGLGYRVNEALAPYETVLEKNGAQHE